MGRGGMRWGAGRPAWHVKAEHCRRIEAGRWAREGLFNAGRSGVWAWTDADSGEVMARIGYCGRGGAVSLNFTVNADPVRQYIRELRTPCHYGGSRSWFACPRCARRVGVLYLRGGAGFVCRQCARVAYGSQSDDDTGRAWRKQHKAEARLGKYWSRPKGMHQTTRDKLVAIILACERRRDDALADYMSRHLPGWCTR